MPLPHAARRELKHLRDVVLRGYQREDGLIDIEARMTDTKPYSFENFDRGEINAGEKLHDMWLRITMDRDMVILSCEAAMDGTPFGICPAIAPNFARLAGLRIGRGFIKEAMRRVGGTEGCTHLRELLQPMATTAFQTLTGLKPAKAMDLSPRNPALLNSCHAYAENGPIIARARAMAEPEE